MTRPNLEDMDELYAYKRELRKILPVQRILSVVCMVGGALIWLWPRFAGGPLFIGSFQTAYIGWAVIAVGWALAGYVIVSRTKYHARRMAEPPT